MGHDLTQPQSDLLQSIRDKHPVVGNRYNWWTVDRSQNIRTPVPWQDVFTLMQRGLAEVFIARFPPAWCDREVQLTAAGVAHFERQSVQMLALPPPVRSNEVIVVDTRSHIQPPSVKAPEPPPPPRNNEMTAAEAEARRRLVLEMHDAGERQMDIAEALGVSRSRTHQLLHTVLRERERQAARQIVMAKVAAMAVYERRADLLRSAERRACAALGEVSVRRVLAQWVKLGSHDNREAPP